MKKRRLVLFIILLSTIAYAQVNMSVDVYNRYVWRGTDYGNAASIQPNIEYAIAGFTIGAWGAWAINGAGDGNENDLYVTTSIGPVSLTLTDYFFPEYDDSDAIYEIDSHIFEVSGGIDIGPVATLVALNVSGDEDNSAYLEVGYKMLTVGVGNGFYSKDGTFAPVSLALSGEKDNINISYIFNPDQETSFLVVGFQF